MASSIDKVAAERVQAALALFNERGAGEGDVLRFAQPYLESLDAEDLVEREPLDLYGAVLSLWRFAEARKPGEPKLRVYNSSVEEHGWQSPHTVVQIVNDDMPFLVDSLQMALQRHGLTLHFISHPILTLRRNADGKLEELVGGPTAHGGTRESLMHIEVERIVDPTRREELAADLARVLGDVRIAVSDWKPMQDAMRRVSAELAQQPPPLPAPVVAETRAFLDWLVDNHFTFVGYRMHDLVETKSGAGLAVVKGSGLGLLRETSEETLSPSFMQLPARLREHARERNLLFITKSNWRSTVHRPGYLDYIGLKRFDGKGNVSGEHRFIGVYTSTAYSAKPADIPLLRRKVAHVLEDAGFRRESHAGKSLANILDTYPRDELFQIDEATLETTALAILKLEGRQRLRLFLRFDMFERFVSCLIYAPRDRYTTELRVRWQKILVDAFAGSGSDFGVLLSESALVRVLITVRTTPGQVPQVDQRDLERRLAEASRRWEDELQQALDRALGEGPAGALHRRYAHAFPAAYREDFPARSAVHDIGLVEQAIETGKVAINLYRPVDAAPGALRFKVASKGGPVPLSNALPMLERMGLTVIEERPYRVSPDGAERSWLHDYGLVAPDVDVDVEDVRPLFEDAFARIFAGEIESDDFNRLVLRAKLAADEVVVLRAYGRYMRQIAFPLSQSFIEQTLAAHPAIARMLVSLFRLRFDPGSSDGDAPQRQTRAIDNALENVANLNEDRVLRQYVALLQATLRTNFWRVDQSGARKSYLSFKLDSSKVPGMPEPRPMFEIFVYSTRFEGVHLRGGTVARGGLRWSDRPEDFRTEILGLVKAQIVKNVVIVPTGSKGGFVLKRAPPPTDREAFMREGIACYQNYLRGLLDITDNRVGDRIVPPTSVRRHDGDDPYLVVAADKGTATFSDFANAISAEYGFWLGDAFASGGSAGYDHKKMGITARGAWESVKRHFSELGVDTQATDFTVVGIGDMSGDVFGNGMLLSEHIRLLAAFDHRHVFIDPDADAASSFVERKRLFELPRSSWADYDAAKISDGGGVWSRSAKSIPLSPQARKALAIELPAGTTGLPPNELISAILKSPADLLYNGGIGTYVKSSAESNADVGDRANDGLRVNGKDLRCRVVAEGGNLGCTQLGRIEYAQSGGRINTDAIDNSAGVDTSDHEVNLKILLAMPIAEGALTEKQRNALLASMTEEVAALVLRDNYEQTQVLSLGSRLAAKLITDDGRFIRFLERKGRLNRGLEFLPSDEEIAERDAADRGLTSPERAVLLAYAKIWLSDEIARSNLPDDPWVATALVDYFPEKIQRDYATFIERHPLRREIITTVVVNQTVNRVGPAFVHRFRQAMSTSAVNVVRAFLLTRESFGLRELWASIEALDSRVRDEQQASMMIDIGQLTNRATEWFLQSPRLGDDMGSTVARFRPGIAKIAGRLVDLLHGAAAEDVRKRETALVATHVPEPLARRIATIQALAGALDIVDIAGGREREVEPIASIYYELGGRLGLDAVAKRIEALPVEGHWQTLARNALRDDLHDLQRVLTTDVVKRPADGNDTDRRIAAWEAANAHARERASCVVDNVQASPAPDLAMLSVALRELRNLASVGAPA
ncbi:MAG TPA: NAD-glutamate dehydrogenase [Casimicrobiaceae bacterium]|nr:NAD-glutamate dehydrogenase [Casimicrobiaceae bacterium]